VHAFRKLADMGACGRPLAQAARQFARQNRFALRRVQEAA
jgi:hypothetical protein